jgi:hypothetical protein
LKESTDFNPKRGASRLRLLRPHREEVICTRYTCSTEIVKERMLKKGKILSVFLQIVKNGTKKGIKM